VVAEQLGLPVTQPEDVNASDFVETLRRWKADLLVVADFGQILSPAALSTTRMGGINVHASLLPKYRGAAPVAWAIYHSEPETGVSIIQMTPLLDAGGVILRRAIPIDPNETASGLEERLAQLGGEMAIEAVDLLERGEAQPVPQAQELVTKAPRLKKEDGRIEWSRSARQIHDQVRGMNPWPVAYTFWPPTEVAENRVLVVRTQVAETSRNAPAGEVVSVGKEGLVVSTGRGGILLAEVKPAGRKGMTGEEFARGARIQVGDRFA
jgi:methionyl-tRNA formyltransferase